MIGRTKEQEDLNRLYERKQTDLAVIYGRRRVGKTYLVNNTFKGRYAFHHAGLSPVDENVCYLHYPQIKKALEINGVEANMSMWIKEKICISK